MFDPNSQSLTEIFAKGNSISYGPFKLTMYIQNDFKSARLTANDKSLETTPEAKIIMALLIAAEGARVSPYIALQDSGDDRFKELAKVLLLGDEDRARRSAADGAISVTFRSQIYKLRNAISKAIEDPQERKVVLKSIRMVRGHNIVDHPDPRPIYHGGYVLNPRP